MPLKGKPSLPKPGKWRARCRSMISELVTRKSRVRLDRSQVSRRNLKRNGKTSPRRTTPRQESWQLKRSLQPSNRIWNSRADVRQLSWLRESYGADSSRRCCTLARRRRLVAKRHSSSAAGHSHGVYSLSGLECAVDLAFQCSRRPDLYSLR